MFMKKYFISILLIATLLFPGCSKFLDQVPDKDILTIPAIFEKRETAENFLASTYMFMASGTSMESSVGICGADEFVSGTYSRNNGGPFAFKIADGLQMVQEPYDNIWNDRTESAYYAIRQCNIFLDNIGHVYNMTDEEKAEWAAEIKALKAYIYFELVKRYGPIVLVPKNIDVNSVIEDMKSPRVHVDTCFNTIVRLLDEAIVDLDMNVSRDVSRKGFFCKEAAMAFKARVLLYAASPLFNGNEYYTNFKGKNGEHLFSTEYDPEKWRKAAEAADEAVKLCHSLGYQLFSGTSSLPTKKLNKMRDIELSVWAPAWENNEFVFSTKLGAWFYQFTLPLLDSKDANYNAMVKGYVAPSLKMAEIFYTENGLPIDYDKRWPYENRYSFMRETDPNYENVVILNEDVLVLHLKREPRFYACIAADGCYWKLGPKLAVNNLPVRTHRGERFGLLEDRINSAVPQNLTGYWVKKFNRTDFLLKEYGTGLTTLNDCPFPIMRLAELYLIQAEAWNEYEGPSAKVFESINKIRERAGIPDVETSWREYSKSPDKITTKEGVREIIQRENAIEFAFEGHRYWDLRRWKRAHLELNQKPMGWNRLGETQAEVFNHGKGPQVVWNQAGFKAPRDYLYPIRSEEAMICGYVQNPGW